MKLYNIHHVATFNLGDRYCGVDQYFDLGCKVEDIGSFKPEPESAVIYGGGGLLYEAWAPILAARASVAASRTVLWGVGTNTHGAEAPTYPGWMRSCMVGLRDADSGFRWVPCPSCMSPLFDRRAAPSREVVVYRHAWVSVLPEIDAPSMSNSALAPGGRTATLATAVEFLSSGEFVVTDSYHGAYWATLLGRKVIVYPYSTRHRRMRHPAPLLRPEESWWSRTKEAKSYGAALEECRAANAAFFRDVKDFLGIDRP